MAAHHSSTTSVLDIFLSLQVAAGFSLFHYSLKIKFTPEICDLASEHQLFLMQEGSKFTRPFVKMFVSYVLWIWFGDAACQRLWIHHQGVFRRVPARGYSTKSQCVALLIWHYIPWVGRPSLGTPSDPACSSAASVWWPWGCWSRPAGSLWRWLHRAWSAPGWCP